MAIEVGVEKILKLPEAAERCSVTVTTVRDWINKGKLEGVMMPWGLATSVEALQRMAERLGDGEAAAGGAKAKAEARAGVLRSAAAAKANEAAKKKLAAMGV